MTEASPSASFAPIGRHRLADGAALKLCESDAYGDRMMDNRRQTERSKTFPSFAIAH
jgi:hypothetical protein